MTTVLKSLKGDKTVTFRYWRYWLLHWCLGINPRTPEESTAASFLYTHFCPLFWLTNLIFVFFLPILSYKICKFCLIHGARITWFASCKTWEGLSFVGCEVGDQFDKLSDCFEGISTKISAKWWAKRRDAAPEPLAVKILPELTEEEKEQQKFWEKKIFLQFVNTYHNHHSFGVMWSYHNEIERNRFKYLTQEEAKKLYEERLEQIAARRQAAIEAAQRRRAKIRVVTIFFVNVSRVVLKVVMNLLALGLFLGSGYLTVVYGGTVVSFVGTSPMSTGHGIAWVGGLLWWLIVGFFSLDFAMFWAFIWPALLFAVLFVAAIAGGVVVIQAVTTSPRTGMAVSKVALPFQAAGSFIGSFCAGLIEFVGMFYEENCPKIHIITADEKKGE